MTTTQPALTLLRLKRTRTQAALDALHIHPTKRPRQATSPSSEKIPRRFRRLPATTDVSLLGPSNIIDIDPANLHMQREPSSESEILYNGEPMSREVLSDDPMMYDLFAEGDNPNLEHLLADLQDCNVAWLHAHDLPVFEDDSSDGDLLSDSDARTVDYPSTPEGSLEGASEDEWREGRTRRGGVQWGDMNPDESDDFGDLPVYPDLGDYDGDCESEQEGDNYDYED